MVGSVALPFLIFPHFSLGLFGLSAGDGMWVRLNGVYIGILGVFYIAAVLNRMDRIFVWTVPARYVSAIFLAVMVVLDKAGLALLAFSAFDAFSASLTWLAIKAEEEVPA